jgi:hypothetical protein
VTTTVQRDPFALLPPPQAGQYIEHDGVRLRIITLTPEIAREWVDHFNPLNRPLSDERVEMFVRLIKNGEWKFLADPIRFALLPDGRVDMFDGQHRAWAVVFAEQSVPILLADGFDQSVRPYVDNVRPRSAADQFAMDGIKYHKNVASGAALLIRWHRGVILQRSYQLAPPEIHKWVNEHPLIIETAAEAGHIRNRMWVIPSAVAAFLY